jgi:hypothetical protein
MTSNEQALARLMGEDLYVWSASQGYGRGLGYLCGGGFASGFGGGPVDGYGIPGYDCGDGEGCGQILSPDRLLPGNGLGGGFDYGTFEGDSFEGYREGGPHDL